MVTSRSTRSAATALLSVIFAGPAVAAPAPLGSESSADGYYAYADVVQVSPRYGWHEISEPVRRCVQISQPHDRDWKAASRYERHRRYQHHHRREQRRQDGNAAAGLVGGLIGGLIGNQFGGGDGKKALTVAGALLGASIARDHSRRQDDQDPRYRRYRDPSAGYPSDTRQCTESRRTRQVRGIDGYDVTYRYQGGTFHKRVNEHPGDVIRIRVAVEPVQ